MAKLTKGSDPYGHDDDGYHPSPNRYQSPTGGQQPQQYGYQLEDHPQQDHGAPLEIPMGPGPGPGTPGDRLQGQPTVSVAGLKASFCVLTGHRLIRSRFSIL